MTPTLPDDADDWASAWHARLADSADFAAAADGFEATVLFTVRPDETYDGDPVSLLVDVADDALSVSVVDDADYEYALHGPYAAWKSLLRGDLAVSDAVMGGPFDVEGNTVALLNHRDVFAEMVRAGRAVDVEFAY